MPAPDVKLLYLESPYGSKRYGSKRFGSEKRCSMWPCAATATVLTSQDLVTTQVVTTGQHVTTGHGQQQHAAVAVLVHCALVVVAQVVVVAAQVAADTTPVAENAATRASTNREMAIFFILFPLITKSNFFYSFVSIECCKQASILQTGLNFSMFCTTITSTSCDTNLQHSRPPIYICYKKYRRRRLE